MNLIPSCDLAGKTDSLVALADGLLVQARIVNNPEVLRHLSTMAFDLLRVNTNPTVEVLV